MKITKFEIQLQNPQPVYYAGQTIAGQVYLELAAELDFRAITLALHGDANVNWTEHHGSGKNRRTVRYHNHENYLNIKLYLIGDGKEKSKLQAGGHNFPFSITLPMNLPSTFMGAHGRVLYYFKCNIDRPWKRDNNLHLYVTIVSLYDLNNDPNAVKPLSNNGTKTFGCLCCTTGPLNATLSLPKLGYVCGETIFFSANIENLSSKVMTKSSIKLIQTDVYRASTGKQRSVRRTILSHQEASIAPGASFTWGNVGLLIPPLPPSQLIYCNIIDVYYTVELSVDPSGIGFDLNVPINVTIGTIPLRQQYQHINYQNAAGPSGELPDASAPPPPSYGEVVHGKEAIEGAEGEGNTVQGGGMYAPQYPTYEFKG